jgi:small-conductance mechanosensitive channel
MKAPLTTILAVLSGLIVLLAYFLPITILKDSSQLIINWAVSLSGMAMLVAIISLVASHWQKLRQKKNAERYSILVIFGFLLTLLFGLVLGGPGNSVYQNVVTHIILPIEAGLLGALAAGLVYAGFRLYQANRGWMTLVFGISTVLFLLLYSGIFTSGLDIPIIKEALGVLQRLPDAGGRGIVIGLALGTIAAGLRILLGVDRPYSS